MKTNSVNNRRRLSTLQRHNVSKEMIEFYIQQYKDAVNRFPTMKSWQGQKATDAIADGINAINTLIMLGRPPWVETDVRVPGAEEFDVYLLVWPGFARLFTSNVPEKHFIRKTIPGKYFL